MCTEKDVSVVMVLVIIARVTVVSVVRVGAICGGATAAVNAWDSFKSWDRSTCRNQTSLNMSKFIDKSIYTPYIK